MFLKSHGGAKIKFVGKAFNVLGDVGEGKDCGRAWKIVGSTKHPWGSHFVEAVTEGCLVVCCHPELK